MPGITQYRLLRLLEAAETVLKDPTNESARNIIREERFRYNLTNRRNATERERQQFYREHGRWPAYHELHRQMTPYVGVRKLPKTSEPVSEGGGLSNLTPEQVKQIMADNELPDLPDDWDAETEAEYQRVMKP